MYDQSFTKSSIEKMIKNSDYYSQPGLKVQKDTFVADAYAKVLSGCASPLDVNVIIQKGMKANKNVYSFKHFADKLLIRKIAKNLKVKTGVKQQDRDSIVCNLKKLLSEGVAYRIYRKDIKDFYGSVSPAVVIADADKNRQISRPTIRLIKNVLGHFSGLEKGLPRGLHISALLAESSMVLFDKNVENHPEVFFYARFVDDILILTSGREDEQNFLRLLTDYLPNGMVFNNATDKEYIKSVPKLQKGIASESVQADFNFLGYNFKSYQPITKGHSELLEKTRPVSLDLSFNKIKRIKTKIIKAFLAFLKDGDFDLLYDRIKMLTGNYYIFDRDRHVKRTAGIYYSCKHVTVDPTSATSAISKLDKFFLSILLSGKGGISTKLQTKLSKVQKRKLLGQTFRLGFSNKVLHHFNSNRMIQITRCWNG